MKAKLYSSLQSFSESFSPQVQLFPFASENSKFAYLLHLVFCVLTAFLKTKERRHREDIIRHITEVTKSSSDSTNVIDHFAINNPESKKSSDLVYEDADPIFSNSVYDEGNDLYSSKRSPNRHILKHKDFDKLKNTHKSFSTLKDPEEC